MPVLLVRHAVAVDRHRWDGDDDSRPLTERGRRQAAGLVDQFAGLSIGKVLSSPALRCVDTVAPLAAARALDVRRAGDLAEGSGPRAERLVRALLADGADDEGVVLCTHGDVVGDVLGALEREGAELVGAPGCQKGSTWLLEAGTVVLGRYLAPPA